jgi:hypothetical protein
LLDVFGAKGSEDIHEMLIHQMFGDTTLAMCAELRVGSGAHRLQCVVVGGAPVSMWRYPARRAAPTARSVPAGGDLEDSEPQDRD